MSKLTFYLTIIFYLVMANLILSLKITYAFFNDSSTSTNNVFAAAATFPTLTPTPTPIGIANHIVISEVQIRGNGTGAAAKDFIELYNPLSTPYDLNGHRIVRRDSNDNADNSNDIIVWQTSTIIPSHGFYLWANSENGFAASISADGSSTQNIGTNNSIGLRNGPKNT